MAKLPEAIQVEISEENLNSNPKNSRVKNFWKLFKLGGPKTTKDLDLYVRFSIFIAILFTAIVLVLFTITGSEPDTLITCFFGMFGGEVFFCAMIKLFKLHSEAKIQNGMEDDKDASDDSSCE